jgi:hypothetical protein
MHGVLIEMQAVQAWFAWLQSHGHGKAFGCQAVLVDCTRVTRICCALMLWKARQARRASMRRLVCLRAFFSLKITNKTRFAVVKVYH